MAISTISDLQKYEAQFQTGLIETVATEIDVFNSASNGGMRIMTDNHRGDLLQEAFWGEISGLNSHRDPTSTASVTPLGLNQDEFVSPKVNKRMGPVEFTNDSLRKISEDPAFGLFVLGQKAGPRILEAQRESAVSALVGSFSDTTVANELVQDSSTGSITSSDLVKATMKLGDGFNQVVAWVMHSKVFSDLIQSQISDKIDGVTSFNLFEGLPATLGKPVLVTDSPALFAAGSSTTSSTDDEYYTFGLVNGGLDIMLSEEMDFLVDRNSGENITTLWQNDYAYTVSVKGMKWTGSNNPQDSALATGSNWSKVATDKRNLAGVALKTR